MFTHENKHLGKPEKKKVKFRAMANTVNKNMGICPIFLNDAVFIT